MPAFAKVVTDNAARKWSYVPVALFVGGTSGIGRGTALAFAKHTKGNTHIIICGRNRSAAESLIATFPEPTSPEAKHEFIECDATRMRNVRATTQSLLERLPKLNYLAITCGIMTLKGRDETEEGIDTKLAVHYYARWKVINDLIPLIQKAKDAGEDSKVLTVFSAGNGGKIDVDDLGLKKHFSVVAAALQGPSYNDAMVKVYNIYPILLIISFPDLPSFSRLPNDTPESLSAIPPLGLFVHNSCRATLLDLYVTLGKQPIFCCIL